MYRPFSIKVVKWCLVTPSLVTSVFFKDWHYSHSWVPISVSKTALTPECTAKKSAYSHNQWNQGWNPQCGKSSESVQLTCWRPVTHVQTWASYSAMYRFGSLSHNVTTFFLGFILITSHRNTDCGFVNLAISSVPVNRGLRIVKCYPHQSTEFHQRSTSADARNMQSRVCILVKVKELSHWLLVLSCHVTVGERSFASAGPKLWNSLPDLPHHWQCCKK